MSELNKAIRRYEVMATHARRDALPAAAWIALWTRLLVCADHAPFAGVQIKLEDRARDCLVRARRVTITAGRLGAPL